MGDSILTSVKKVLHIAEGDASFDDDIIMHINSVFPILEQIGIGPLTGFAIEDATPTWDAFLGDDARLNSVKTYMYLKVRLLFDPPATSFHLQALEKQAEEFLWRLNVLREGEAYPLPT